MTDLMGNKGSGRKCTEGQEELLLLWGHGVFQKGLSPLFSRWVCMIPLLLCGCENWILSEELLRQLDSFKQGCC